MRCPTHWCVDLFVLAMLFVLPQIRDWHAQPLLKTDSILFWHRRSSAWRLPVIEPFPLRCQNQTCSVKYSGIVWVLLAAPPVCFAGSFNSEYAGVPVHTDLVQRVL